MKKVWIYTTAALLLGGGAGGAETILNGAGATFPAPVYREWTHAYGEDHAGVTVNYQPIGSGAGVRQLEAKTVDFAGTDNPLTKEELDKAGFVQYPMLAGGVVVVVNLPGIANGALKLDGPTLADIFRGTVSRWDDAAIARLNPDLNLPKLKITVVRRGDSSGTSYIFTSYLTKVSKEWAESVGAGPAVKWPTGIAGQKNPGVCNNVSRSRGAIGYTEYTYAKEYKLAMCRLKNREGNFAKAEPKAFSAAVANADWENAPAFRLELTDQPGADAWPITGITYMVFPKKMEAARKAELMKFFRWCYTTGRAAAERLDYVPLSSNVVELVLKADR